jgi:hypothetical protein
MSDATLAVSPKAKRVRRVDRTTLIRTDQRTREMRLWKRMRAEFTKQLGDPTAVEKVLVDRAATLAVYLAVADREAIEDGGEMSEYARKAYLAYNNSLVRTLKALGLKTEHRDAALADITASDDEDDEDDEP